jgi:hypothetical protein
VANLNTLGKLPARIIRQRFGLLPQKSVVNLGKSAALFSTNLIDGKFSLQLQCQVTYIFSPRLSIGTRRLATFLNGLSAVLPAAGRFN